jgi:hypothetical protein
MKARMRTEVKSQQRVPVLPAEGISPVATHAWGKGPDLCLFWFTEYLYCDTYEQEELKPFEREACRICLVRYKNWMACMWRGVLCCVTTHQNNWELLLPLLYFLSPEQILNFILTSISVVWSYKRIDIVKSVLTVYIPFILQFYNSFILTLLIIIAIIIIIIIIIITIIIIIIIIIII